MMPPFGRQGTPTTGKSIRDPDGRRLRRFEREFTAAVGKALNQLRLDVQRGISDANVEEMVARLDDGAVTRPFQDAIVRELQKVALDGADFGRLQVERDVFGIKALEVGMWELANNAAAEWALSYGYDLVRELLGTTRKRLQREVREYVRNSETIGQLMKRIAAGGVFGQSRALTIAVTEVTRAYAEGNRAAWKASGVIEGRKWRTNADEIVRNCPVCAPLNGLETTLDEPWQHPTLGAIDIPGHPRCRCWSVPVLKVMARVPAPTAAPIPALIPEPEPEPALDADGFPTRLDGLEPVRSLGGSTGAELVREPVTGKQFVMKRGASAEHVRREVLADDVYRSMGVRVPAARLYETPGGPVKLAEFIDGKPLKDFMRDDGTFPTGVLREVREGFAADVVLGNRDVVGMDFDNILMDSAGRAWRIDNGGSLDFRAQGGRKAFDGFPLELWTMRDARINRQTSAVFGAMDYGDLMEQTRTLVGRRGDALGMLPDELRDAFTQRVDRLGETVRQYDELVRDGWKRTYPDRFSYFGMKMEQSGLFDRLPRTLSNQGVQVFDEQGVAFDHLRGSQSIMHEVRGFIDSNGGDYGMVQRYMGDQAGSSWSGPSSALKHWLTTQMEVDESQVYWRNRSQAREEFGYVARRFGEDKYANTWQAFHSFNYNMLRRTEFRGNNRETGMVRLIRTESGSIMRGYGLRKGAKQATMPRGLAESSSIFEPIFIGGSKEVTYQDVPHSRILGMYFYNRDPGSPYGSFMSDRENEFVFVPYGIKFEWPSAKKKELNSEN